MAARRFAERGANPVVGVMAAVTDPARGAELARHQLARGADVAIDEHNAGLVTAQMKQRVEAARADIVAGRPKVIDGTVANGWFGECVAMTG